MATKAYYIPEGTKNLQAIFPLIDFYQVAEYYVELVDILDIVVATTPINRVCGCEHAEDVVRIHFLNALGGIDAVNFKLRTKEHEAKSDSYEKPTQYPLDKTVHSINRFNVKSNDTHLAVTLDYNEEHFDWLDELVDSPLAWMEWAGTQGQPASFLPVVILDKKITKQKEEDRYYYEYEIEFKFSHEKFNIRN